MRKLYLSVVDDGTQEPDVVRITSDRPGAKKKGGLVRYSPIYSVCPINATVPLEDGTGCVLFLYSLRSYDIVSQLKKSMGEEILAKVWLSHGWASVIFFLDNKASLKNIYEVLADYCVGYEEWDVQNGNIVTCEHNIEIKEEPLYTLEGVGELNYKVNKIVHDLVHSLNNACRMMATYAPNNVKMLESIANDMQRIIALYLFLTGIWGQDKFGNVSQKCTGNLSEEKFKKYLQDSIDLKNSEKDLLVRLDQLHDEIVHIYAVFKSISSQAFSGIAPLKLSAYRSGEFSLLGFSISYFALAALYEQVRSVFSDIDWKKTFSEQYKKSNSIDILRNFGEYSQWLSALKKQNYPDYVTDSTYKENAKYHLLYFSNRFGFKETKHAISAAYQSVTNACAPPWNLTTLTHEYSHAITRVILASIFPHSISNNGNEFDELYDIYKDTLNEHGQAPKNLLQFVRLQILWVSTYLSNEPNKGFSPLPKNLLLEKMQSSHHMIDEIMAHLFDFKYFFGEKIRLYVTTVWATWFALPQTLNRQHEYFLRTILTVASKNTTPDFSERFKWSYDAVYKNIEKLKNYDFSNSMQIDVYLKDLEKNKSKLALIFPKLIGFVDMVSRILISGKVKSKILNDDNLAQHEEGKQSEDSVEYGIEYGSYDLPVPISPVMFILEQVEEFLENKPEINSEESEYRSLWMASVLCASLLQKEAGSYE